MNRGILDLVQFGTLYDPFLASQNAIFTIVLSRPRGVSWLVPDMVRTENGSEGFQFVSDEEGCRFGQNVSLSRPLK